MATPASAHHAFHGRSETVLVVTIVMFSLSTIFVAFRMLSRGAIVRRIMLDDYFIMLAWMLAFGLSFCVCWATGYGLGRHEIDIPAEWQGSLRKSIYAASVLYQPALMATKTSILVFYLTLSKADRAFRWGCIATLCVINAGGIALTFVTAFQCSPVNALFMSSVPAGAHCTDVLTIYLASVPLNLITDLALLLLPMPILTAMRLPRKQKIILLVTFGAGAFVAVVDVVRISYLQNAAEARLSDTQMRGRPSSMSIVADQVDSSWYLSFTYLWTAIEVNAGIMCACVPALKPLVARFLPTMLRDKGEFSRAGSRSEKGVAAETGGVPDLPPLALPEDVHHPRDFGSFSDSMDSGIGGPMDMIDFLTTPDMTELPMHRTTTCITNTSRDTAPPEPTTMFNFVNMKKHKPLTQLSHRESILPLAAVTLLFFIWGFSYGLLNVLNRQFQIVAHVTAGQSTAIHSAYFSGYFAGPLIVGRLVLKYWSFKACFVVGLFIYAAGLLIYWPAAVLSSWPTFVVTNFIVGFGLSVLETACNPFIFLCGPAGYGEIRLNLSQGLQAIGSIVAPLIAQKAFFNKENDTPSLVDTQWAYLGMSLAMVILGMIYFYVPLPGATDAELADAVERSDGADQARVGPVRVIWVSLALAVFSLFCYVGGQEVNGTTFTAYLAAGAPAFDASNASALAHTAFAVARFCAAGLGFWVKPRHLLAGFLAGAIVFGALSVRLSGNAGAACLIIVYFMEGPIFSLVFAQGLHGMGRHTRRASVLLTAAISGGAVFSPISNAVTQTVAGASTALIVALAVFAAATVFPIALIVYSPLRRLVEYPAESDGPPSSRPSSMSSRAGRRVMSFIDMGKGKKGRESQTVEHRERKSSTGI